MSNTIIPVGKYAGKKIKDVPTTYITYSLEVFPMSDDMRNEMIRELLTRTPSIKDYMFDSIGNSFFR